MNGQKIEHQDKYKSLLLLDEIAKGEPLSQRDISKNNYFNPSLLPKPGHDDLLAAALACAAQEARQRLSRGDGEASQGAPSSDGFVPTGWTATRLHGMRER